MKKSEMVYKLREFLLSCNYEQFIANDANGIIDFLVGQGMKPPEVTVLMAIPETLKSDIIYFDKTFNEWEKENDQH